MKIRTASAAALLLAAVTACSSAPVHYYTLVPPLAAGSPAPQQASGVEVLPVTVPPAADYPQLVVRQSAERVSLVETEQWIAPLPQEIRNALIARLAPVSAPVGVPDLKLTVSITRFDSVLGSYALLESQWQLRSGQNEPLVCSSRVSETVGEGFEALVAGHQRALDRLANDIAVAVRTGAHACPAGV